MNNKRNGYTYLLAAVLLFTLPAYAGKVKQFHIRENDSTTYVLNLALDEAGQPLYYFRNIYTPVCNTGECKPVYINFYWDLLGNYQRFDLPEKEELTKLDHRPFEPEDYAKLQQILANPSSILADLQMDELVVPGTEMLSDSIDGVTRATPKTIKNEVIDGAVYTCYTLWHLAYGPVTTEIKRITATYKSERLLHQFLEGDNHHYQYWALERVLDNKGRVAPGFEKDLRNIISGKNIFIARHTVQQLYPAFFQSEAAQQWLLDTYQRAVYPLQLVLLKKMAVITMNGHLAGMLLQQLPAANAEQRTLMLAALRAQPRLSAAHKKKLSDYEHTYNQTTN